MAVDWCRSNSLWPFFFGLSCCFVEEATAFTSRYDIARFGSEVFRGSPRQSDVLIVSGTIFKKVAPVVLRLYEQMAEPRWVISMGSCSNTGGMFDVYSVVQGVDQILPVDIYVPGCPPRPEALLHGLVALQERIRKLERPLRPILGLPGGSQGGRTEPLVDGLTKSRDTRGPGFGGTAVRGGSATPPLFKDNRSRLMWTPPASRIEISEQDRSLAAELQERFGASVPAGDGTDIGQGEAPGIAMVEPVSDMLTLRVSPEIAKNVLEYLRHRPGSPYARLEDLTAIDESARQAGQGFPDFHLVYTLLDFRKASKLRLKVPLAGESPTADSVTSIWPTADWYEREVHDMFGIGFAGRAPLRPLILPPGWPGHPLRKSHPARATTMAPFTRASLAAIEPADASEILAGPLNDEEMLLNFGPHHYGTHGVMRYVLALHGETIRAMDIEIGYHHRGVEKIAEHQSWHQFIPYTDRVDYLAGLANNLSYVIAVEKLAGIKVPDRAEYIRVLLCEFFRLSNHLLWFGTMVQDLGMMSAVFYSFREREMVLDIVETITGGRLHPSWLRLGGVAQDLPDGWRDKVDAFVKIFPSRLKEYEALFTRNPIFKARTQGVTPVSKEDAMHWGITGPNLRACGLEWDLRKKMPYGAYGAFDFDVPTAHGGDCYCRYLVRMEEMRQSLSIIEQAVRNIPPGRVVTEDSRFALPDKKAALTDIESLIHHFVNVTRGPTVPRGEVYHATESPRGEQGYYVVSDGLASPYRLHIRSPGYANVQALRHYVPGHVIPDLVATLASIDYILPDIDR
jgi:NADH-quinone oxidoreductase subunit B/C/D